MTYKRFDALVDELYFLDIKNVFSHQSWLFGRGLAKVQYPRWHKMVMISVVTCALEVCETCPISTVVYEKRNKINENDSKFNFLFSFVPCNYFFTNCNWKICIEQSISVPIRLFCSELKKRKKVSLNKACFQINPTWSITLGMNKKILLLWKIVIRIINRCYCLLYCDRQLRCQFWENPVYRQSTYYIS